ncbi:uncharacterized protein LOC134180280 [Corticium candelabrum]|uniref:uncharacterized protein LOC134180280 n=1 Tax=Corticium candelabrum TaxID=121492 RepID=UPI002E263E0D|nr:uncharacterized protein LOC134180280 [Corticium candelabrum]
MTIFLVTLILSTCCSVCVLNAQQQPTVDRLQRRELNDKSKRVSSSSLVGGKGDKKKPVINPVFRNDSSQVSSDRQLHVSGIRLVVSKTNKLQTGRLPVQRQSGCSPRIYLMTLKFGKCSTQVETTLCYGSCIGSSRGGTRKFTSTTDVKDGDGGCACCSPRGAISNKHYQVHCTANGRRRRKLFVIPHVGECQCEPCG